jgi:hypothetical protein
MQTLTYHAIVGNSEGKGVDLVKIERDMLAPGKLSEMRTTHVATYPTQDEALAEMRALNGVA